MTVVAKTPSLQHGRNHSTCYSIQANEKYWCGKKCVCPARLHRPTPQQIATQTRTYIPFMSCFAFGHNLNICNSATRIDGCHNSAEDTRSPRRVHCFSATHMDCRPVHCQNVLVQVEDQWRNLNTHSNHNYSDNATMGTCSAMTQLHTSKRIVSFLRPSSVSKQSKLMTQCTPPARAVQHSSGSGVLGNDRTWSA